MVLDVRGADDAIDGTEPNLVRLSKQPVCTRELALVAHPDVLRSARVRAVWDFLIRVVEDNYPTISGIDAVAVD